MDEPIQFPSFCSHTLKLQWTLAKHLYLEKHYLQQIWVDKDGFSLWRFGPEASGKAELFWIKTSISLFWDFTMKIDSHPAQKNFPLPIYLISVIREVNLVKNLGCFVLNGFHFY